MLEKRCPGWKKIEKLTIGGDDYLGLESKLIHGKSNKVEKNNRLTNWYFS